LKRNVEKAKAQRKDLLKEMASNLKKEIEESKSASNSDQRIVCHEII